MNTLQISKPANLPGHLSIPPQRRTRTERKLDWKPEPCPLSREELRKIILEQIG
jgi:hypothetical protein